MRVVYLDCASGLSGDMLLGAMLDAGLDRRLLEARLASLPLSGYRLTTRRVRRAALAGLHVNVHVTGDHAHRGWKEIRSIVRGGRLQPREREAALAVFERLIRVEARLHRIPMEKVHLHELGAVDAIVDIVGAVVGLQALGDILGTGRLVCSPLNVGHGTVSAHHGVLPVPAPATAALLTDIPIYSAGPPGERVTPTGAAIVSTLAHAFGPPPPMVLDTVGAGAGRRDDAGFPNLARILVGHEWPERASGSGHGEVMVLECTIDDMNPQGYGWLMERLFSLGAMDVFYTAVHMKKDRPAVLVTVLCPGGLLQTLSQALFEETTTLGLRYRTSGRIELERRQVPVRTRFGEVRMKVGTLDGREIQAQPEYDDCRRLAARHRVPLRQVQAAATAAWGRGKNR